MQLRIEATTIPTSIIMKQIQRLRDGVSTRESCGSPSTHLSKTVRREAQIDNHEDGGPWDALCVPTIMLYHLKQGHEDVPKEEQAKDSFDLRLRSFVVRLKFWPS